MAKKDTTYPRRVRFTEDGPALEDILKALLRDKRRKEAGPWKPRR